MTNRDAFEWIHPAGGRALVCRALTPFADHLFITRDWALGSRASAGDEDWLPIADAIGVDAAHLVRLHQVHGAAVVVRRAGDSPPVRPMPDADIVITDDRAIALAIQTADCVPLLIADTRRGTIAAAHAGWRGLALGVPRITVAALAAEFGSAPADLIAAIGPSICAERYEVGEDVRATFAAGGFTGAQLDRWFLEGARPGHWQFDGWRCAIDQLAAAGVPVDRIHASGQCTASHPELFASYRRDGPGAGRMAAAIRIKR